MNSQRSRRAQRSSSRPELAAAVVADDSTHGKRVLLAGASGTIGGAIAVELKARGYWVRALTRQASGVAAAVDEIYVGDLIQPNTLEGAADGVDLVVSAAGAPPGFVGVRGGRYSFPGVDDQGNRTLLNVAYEAKVRRFAYVGAFGGRFMGNNEYIRAHESFVAALKTSGVRYHVVRAAPMFESFDGMLKKAKKGKLRVIAGGDALLNPIHSADFATAFVDAVEAREQEVDVGGPEVLSRREIAELAIKAWGKEPRIRNLPLALAMYWAKFAWFRGGHNKFVSAVVTASANTDLVAPELGERTLADYFAEQVARLSEKD